MTSKEILAQLRSMGSESIKKVLAKHGAPANHLGVKIGDMKPIQKQVKKDYKLSLELFDSGIPDAQYLAGLIADETKMTKKDLQHWVDTASWHAINEFTVAWIAAESEHGWELGLKWISSKKEDVQLSGWATLASWVSLKDDAELDIKELKNLLKRVEKEINIAGDRVRYAMNGFVIAAGGYVKDLSAEAIRIGKALGPLTIDMGNTACKVPYAPEYIQKMLGKGVKKKKMARC